MVFLTKLTHSSQLTLLNSPIFGIFKDNVSARICIQFNKQHTNNTVGPRSIHSSQCGAAKAARRARSVALSPSLSSVIARTRQTTRRRVRLHHPGNDYRTIGISNSPTGTDADSGGGCTAGRAPTPSSGHRRSHDCPEQPPPRGHTRPARGHGRTTRQTHGTAGKAIRRTG